MAGGPLQTRHVIMLHKVTWLLISVLRKLRPLVYQLSVLSILRQACLGPQDQESTRFLLSVETGSQATRWQWLLKVDANQDYSALIVLLLILAIFKDFYTF